jgi:hypothetical protein
MYLDAAFFIMGQDLISGAKLEKSSEITKNGGLINVKIRSL